jgi:hypothetical protein
MRQKPLFKPVWVKSSNELEAILTKNIKSNVVSHYLILNEWESVCNYFLDELKSRDNLPDPCDTVYVINIFDIENPLGIMRSVISQFKDSINTNNIRTYTGMPMMVRIHGAYPVPVHYTGSISAELGL